MENQKNLGNVLKEVKNVDKDINNLLIPILQDTIAYTNKHNKRISILAFMELIIILTLAVIFIVFAYKQNIKYHELLSTFNFETEIIQDTDDNSSINSGINFNK